MPKKERPPPSGGRSFTQEMCRLSEANPAHQAEQRRIRWHRVDLRSDVKDPAHNYRRSPEDGSPHEWRLKLDLRRVHISACIGEAYLKVRVDPICSRSGVKRKSA